jgi:predicted helicase
MKNYLKKITATTVKGDAREESYYPHLSGFIEAYAENNGKSKIEITTLPKKTEAGNPDFRVWDGTQNIVGYIEAKKPGENLDIIENSPQLKRYRKTFPNLILTDFYEFRLYRNGLLIDKTFCARAALAKKGIPPPIENEEKFTALLNKFFAFSLPKVSTAEQLAKELAVRTRFLRDEVISLEMEQQQKGKGELFGFYESFKKYLIANITEKDFADLFSQTITYGLFAARTRSANGFNRKLAYDLIPKTIGILRNVFKFISQGDLSRPMEVMVDDIADVLNAADAKNILRQYYKAGKGEDPIVHFYETFLTEYDPATREKRGVYYTPEPVVRYIVRSVHSLLKTHFDLADGLASKEVTLLDPAGGTLTFPAEAIKLAVAEYKEKYGDGGVQKLISGQILKNFYAFELMMAPYAIGHIKISFLLEELGYIMKDDERFKLYLTNTLDMEDLAQTQIPGLESLSEESHEAGKIKQQEPILVILGNPPYSANSSNKSEEIKFLKKDDKYIKDYKWDDTKKTAIPVFANVKRVNEETGVTAISQKNFIGDILQEYYFVDGKPLNEDNPKLLQDDYVKFLRFAQWKINNAGKGIVGMITNHGYLNNITFPGMRESLMRTFNEIYIINLHGDSQKKEKAPDGSKDENVFDITKGTAIAIFVKKPKAKGCKIFYRDIFGLCEIKYDWLNKNHFRIKDYEKLHPETPWYFFIKRDTKEIEHFTKWPSVLEIFPTNSTGIKTHRDDFVIAFKASELENRIRQFVNLQFPDEFVKDAYKIKETSTFKISNVRKIMNGDIELHEKILPISYRPFDSRFIVYSDDIIDRPRKEIMQHLLKNNIALNIVRQVKASKNWIHALVSEEITECCYISNNTSEVCYTFPLYLYKPEEKKKKSGFQTMLLFEPEAEYGKGGKKPNIAPGVFEMLQKAYKKKPTPEQILYYCYAVLYSNVYREKYAEFLKIDFPRIPFTSDYNLFLQLAEQGEELAQLHLLKSKILNRPGARYLGTGADTIEKPVYDEQWKCVRINETKYFEGISKEVWEYHIGGYQVMEKYLKDRKGRQMEDPAVYCKIATAIYHTITIQKQIDVLFNKAEKKLIGA